MPAERHPCQHLAEDLPMTGTWPVKDPEFGWMFDVINNILAFRKEVEDEISFDGIETGSEGEVWLTLKGRRVSRAGLSDHHADARLWFNDPDKGNPGEFGWL